jgi:hypothetical protein
MTIEITGPSETPAPEPPDTLQQNSVQTQDQASDTTVLITEAEVALGTAAATGVRGEERRWVALLSRIFALPKKSRPKRRPYQPRTEYLDRARMAREMERL